MANMPIDLSKDVRRWMREYSVDRMNRGFVRNEYDSLKVLSLLDERDRLAGEVEKWKKYYDDADSDRRVEYQIATSNAIASAKQAARIEELKAEIASLKDRLDKPCPACGD